jgi:hypothetical protein
VKYSFVRVALFLVASVVGSPSLGVAHHSTATFETSKEISLQGTVTSWRWINPHCVLIFEVKDETGRIRTWTAETANPYSMTLRGWSRGTFKAGDGVTVTVQPARNGEPAGILLTAVLPNGDKLDARAPVSQ